VIRETWGDILVDALVNSVNTVGVMGAGLAKQFKAAYRAMFDDYVNACRRGEMLLGSVRAYQTGSVSPRFIISFPTKTHWSQPSRMGFISAGLLSLRQTIERLGITSIAVPALGCGLGGLDWSNVRNLIHQRLGTWRGSRCCCTRPDRRGVTVWIRRIIRSHNWPGANEMRRIAPSTRRFLRQG
jgi:O-acetyl-ADP-ribose deacetylase (regulator of RNase III)